MSNDDCVRDDLSHDTFSDLAFMAPDFCASPAVALGSAELTADGEVAWQDAFGALWTIERTPRLISERGA